MIAMPMNNPSWFQWFMSISVVGCLSFILNVWQYFKGRRKDAELRAIRRRGEAPFFCISNNLKQEIWEKTDTQLKTLGPTWSNVMSIWHPDVGPNIQANEEVILIVENKGQEPHYIKIELEGQAIILGRESELHNPTGLLFIKYPFDPAKRGKEQTIKATFESKTGAIDCHTYLTEHGRNVLKRTDPT